MQTAVPFPPSSHATNPSPLSPNSSPDPRGRPSDRFPEVQRWRGEVAAAEAGLGGLLPAFRRTLQISSLQFMSLHNAGEYLLEVPTELVKRVPKDWAKVGGRALPAHEGGGCVWGRPGWEEPLGGRGW